MDNIIALSPDTTAADRKQHRRIDSDTSTKQKLFVLDLDETLLYQRQQINFVNNSHLNTAYAQIANYNSNELMLSLQEFKEENGQTFNLLGVYRPHLIEFFSKYQLDFDFVMYSSAPIRTAAFHIALMEMYFNFCYRLVHLKHSFHFKMGVFRLDAAPKKSVITLSKLMNILQYEQIVIVDDLLHNPEIWNLQHYVCRNFIGYPIKQWDMNYGYSPSPFTILDAESVEFTFNEVSRIHLRLNDSHLLQLRNL